MNDKTQNSVILSEKLLNFSKFSMNPKWIQYKFSRDNKDVSESSNDYLIGFDYLIMYLEVEPNEFDEYI